jgi:hypothetical protein
MIGCEFCVDLGSQICRNSGFSDEELLALPRYGESDLFTEPEKLTADGRQPRPVQRSFRDRLGSGCPRGEGVPLSAAPPAHW